MAEFVLPGQIVSEKNVYFIQKSRFLSLAFQKFIQIVCSLGLKHYSTLLVELIRVMDGSIFKHDRIRGAIFPGFGWNPYRITLELSKDQTVITLAC